MARLSVDYDDKRLRRNLRNAERNVRGAVSNLVDYHALEITGFMRARARWTDNTGAARNGLIAVANHGTTFEEIVMAYSVWYGIWLEVAHNRKYEILQTTLNVMGPLLMERLNNLMDRIDWDR